MSNFEIAASVLGSSQPTVASLSPSSGMDVAAFESAWQAVSMEPATSSRSNGPSAIADLANHQQSLLSQAFDLTGVQLEGKSSIELTMEMTRKRVEILYAETALNLSWASVKEVRKGIETVMNSK
jgi:hypothetical protein